MFVGHKAEFICISCHNSYDSDCVCGQMPSAGQQVTLSWTKSSFLQGLISHADHYSPRANRWQSPSEKPLLPWVEKPPPSWTSQRMSLWATPGSALWTPWSAGLFTLLCPKAEPDEFQSVSIRDDIGAKARIRMDEFQDRLPQVTETFAAVNTIRMSQYISQSARTEVTRKNSMHLVDAPFR